MKDFLRSYLRDTFRLNTVLVTVLVAVVFIFSGPFGTYAQMGLFARAIYWGPLVVLALAVGGLVCSIEARSFPTHNRYRHGFLSSVGFAVLYAPLIFIISRSGLLGSVENDVPFWYVLVLVFAFAAILGLFIVFTNPLEPAQSNALLPRLYARLPEVGEARISHITVSDHYVEAFLNDGGSHRVLMRFSDAVKEMDQTDGYCTHRSHWVAAKSVKTGKRLGNKDVVELDYGTIVPVSKTYRDNLVQAGFIA